MEIPNALKIRVIQNLLFISVFFCFLSNTYSQNTWELLNPKPSYNTGKVVRFVSDNIGYIINSNEILETNNSGVSWQKKQNITSGNDLNFNQNIGYIVGNSGYVLKSIDSGTSWTQISTGSSGDFNTVNIINETDIIISSAYAIIKSSDGGNTWTSKTIPNVSVNKTFFVTALIGHAACDSGTMLKTIDGGQNWYITQSSNVYPSDLFTVYFINQNIGFYTKEHNDMYKTIDGGETWSKIISVSDAIYNFYFINENVGYATGADGVIFKTIDGGNTWEWAGFQNGRYGNTNMYGIHFLDNNIGYATGARGRIIKTIDGGKTWNENSPTYNDIRQLQFIDNNIGFAEVGDQFFKTVDSGQNWQNVGSLNLGQSVSASQYIFLNKNLGYATTGGPYGGQVYKTLDGGVTWVVLNNGYDIIDEGIDSISFINENTGFISGGFNQRKVLKTIDGGVTWQQVLNEEFGQIQFLNNQVGYAHRIGYSGGRMYKTIDGGNTWNINIDVDENIKSFHFLDENNGYFVGDNSLMYKTKNGGVSWEKLTVPYVYFTFVKFYSKNVGYIFDDYGRLYKTINGGVSWENLTTINSYGSPSNSISIVEKNIYVGGSNGKILKGKVSFDPFSILANPVLNPSNKGATLTGNITSNEGLIQNIRFEFGTNYTFDNIINTNPNTVTFDSSLNVSTVLLNLSPNTTYYYKLIATYNSIDYSSEILSFKTLPDYVLTMNDTYSYSSNTAEVTGNITSNQNDISNIEFQYGEKQDFSTFNTLTNNTLVKANTTGNIMSNLLNLKPETTYYVRMKATHNGIEIYSSVKSFKTKSEYSIYLYNPSINGNSVTLAANISAYSKDITNIIFEYGTINYENNIATNIHQIPVNSSNYVTAILSSLDPSVTYYYRIKALNGTNIIYSKEAVFNTSGNIILVPGTINNETTSINLIGLINANGRYLTNIQFEYGLTESYGSTINGSPNFVYGYGTNTITAILENLLPNQIYYYRLKATDNNNVIYSNKFQLKTGTLNIEDFNENNDKILLYPNPTNNETNITINGFKNAVTIMLIDISGKVLISQDNPNLKNDFKFNLSDKSKGIYFIKILFDDNTSINKKLILE
jgi:photosystem II stability/assembly factor-like uncharacterized protein